MSQDDRIGRLLLAPSIDTLALRRLSWHGVPEELRETVWPLLLAYTPTVGGPDKRAATLLRKRSDYRSIVGKYFCLQDSNDERADDDVLDLRPKPNVDQDLLHQISIDVPRTCPDVPLFKSLFTRRSMARILYCWSIRRPASSYVQGINDVLSPFMAVFFSCHNVDDPSALLDKEADCFWCFSKFIDVIQDHYVGTQPGIQRQLALMKELVRRVEPRLWAHLSSHDVQFGQFAFRWMNCLLQRELPFALVVRLFDTYLSAEDLMQELAPFHAFVCAAFLLRQTNRLLELTDFGDLLLALQNPNTRAWSERDLATLVSEAFVLRSLYGNTLSPALSAHKVNSESRSGSASPSGSSTSSVNKPA